MSVKINKEIFNKDLESQGRTVRLVGEYEHNKTKTQFKCLICSNTWLTAPTNVRNKGRGCPKCAGNEKLTKDRINSLLSPRKIVLLSEYTNSTSKLKFLCNTCSHQWETTTNHVLHHSGCPNCAKTAWDTQGFLYIFVSDKGIKIGISKNVQKRLLEVRSCSGFKDLRVSSYYICGKGSKEETAKIEADLHSIYKNKRCSYAGFSGSTEFFNVSPVEVEQYIETHYEVRRCTK